MDAGSLTRHASLLGLGLREAGAAGACHAAQVISMRDVPSTLYTRPQRPGPTDRFEPGDALIRTYIESD